MDCCQDATSMDESADVTTGGGDDCGGDTRAGSACCGTNASA